MATIYMYKEDEIAARLVGERECFEPVLVSMAGYSHKVRRYKGFFQRNIVMYMLLFYKMDYISSIKYIRDELIFSQDELTKELDVSYAAINRWEIGHNFSTIKVRRKIRHCCKNAKMVKFSKFFRMYVSFLFRSLAVKMSGKDLLVGIFSLTAKPKKLKREEELRMLVPTDDKRLHRRNDLFLMNVGFPKRGIADPNITPENKAKLMSKCSEPEVKHCDVPKDNYKFRILAK